VVTGVSDGVVEVAFRGMCSGCPISPLTLHLRFERELRERCPELVAVRAACRAGGGATGLTRRGY
ncbi:MAG: NifU family protein, partial [Gluconacetobacter sp.]